MVTFHPASDHSFYITANGMTVSSVKLIYAVNEKAIALLMLPVGVNMHNKHDAVYAFPVGKPIKVYYETSAGSTQVFNGTVCSIAPYADITSEDRNGYYVVAHGHLGTLMSGVFLNDIFSPQAFRDMSSQAWTSETLRHAIEFLTTSDFVDALKDICLQMLEWPLSEGIGAKIARMQEKSTDEIRRVIENYMQGVLNFDVSITPDYLEGLAKHIIALLINDFYKTPIGDKLIQLGRLLNFNMIDTPSALWFTPKTALYPKHMYRPIDHFYRLNVITGNETQNRYSGCIVTASTNNAQTDSIESQEHILGLYMPPEPWNVGQPIVWPLPDFFSKAERLSSGLIVQHNDWDLGLLDQYAMHLYWLSELAKYRAVVDIPFFCLDYQAGTPVQIQLGQHQALRYLFRGTVYGVIQKVTLIADVNAQEAHTSYELAYCVTHRELDAAQRENRYESPESHASFFGFNSVVSSQLAPYGGFWETPWPGCTLSGHKLGG